MNAATAAALAKLPRHNSKKLTSAQRDLILKHSGASCVNDFADSFKPGTKFLKARGHDALRVTDGEGKIFFYSKGREGLLCRDGKMIHVVGKSKWADTLKDFVAGRAY